MDPVTRFADRSPPEIHIRTKAGKERARARRRHRTRHSDSSVRGLRRSAEKLLCAVPGAKKGKRRLQKGVKSQTPGGSVESSPGPVRKGTSQLVFSAIYMCVYVVFCVYCLFAVCYVCLFYLFVSPNPPTNKLWVSGSLTQA